MAVAEIETSMGLRASLVTQVTTEGTATVVTVRGEADANTLPELAGVLARAISERAGPVVVDLRAASFVDIRTLWAFGRAAELLAWRDRVLVLRHPSAAAIRVLALLGLSQLIVVEPLPRDRDPRAADAR